MGAIPDSLKTRAVGYQTLNRTFSTQTTNLPMRVALLGEPNTANVSTLDTAPFIPTSLKQVGDKYGFGSPLYQMARILLPVYGGGISSLPIVIYPQAPASGATATSIVLGIAVASTVTKTITHTLRIAGRDNIDGARYDFTVTEGMNTAAVVGALTDCINNVLSAPVTAVAGTGISTVTTKWKGLTSAQLQIEIDTNGDAAGIVYSETSRTDGTTTPSITDALGLFGNEWNTLICNSYSVATIYAELEVANGTPESNSGKYTTTTFKPFLAIAGYTEDTATTLAAITNATARQDQVTNVFATAPNSKGMDYEAAANAIVLAASIANETPHLGIAGKSYPDMPVPLDGNIGDMATLENRNYLMLRGCSTVLLENGKYTVQDFVTTYAPSGEIDPKFRYVRDVIVDWNIGYGWKIIVIRDIQDKAVVKDGSAVRVGDVTSPRQTKALLIGYLKECEAIALINDSQYSIDSSSVTVSTSRLNVFFQYKRTSTANQVSTDAAVDFTYNL